MRTFTLDGWQQSVVVENGDGSTGLTLTAPDGGVTVLSIAGGAEARITLDASAPPPRPASLGIEASAPEPKE